LFFKIFKIKKYFFFFLKKKKIEHNLIMLQVGELRIRS
jgi:hypothetical protein